MPALKSLLKSRYWRRCTLELGAAWVALVAGSGAVAHPLLRVCLNETAHPPWRESDALGRARRTGLDYVFLQQLEARSGYRVQVEPMPWRRCLEAVQAGAQDAVFGISYLPEREVLGVFPPPRGAPDEQYAIRRFDFSWYVRRDSPARWDGQQLSGLPKPVRVVAQPGFSIGQVLRGRGYSVREAARSSEGNLHLVLQGEADVAALQTHEADRVQALDATLMKGVRKLEPILQQRIYFVVFSRAFHDAQPERALRLWRQMAEVRDSEAYRQAEGKVLP
ncbi:MAG: transporter substrate-binding domain-containing protein [Inhella sp.]